jgi:hypothetical protein
MSSNITRATCNIFQWFLSIFFFQSNEGEYFQIRHDYTKANPCVFKFTVLFEILRWRVVVTFVWREINKYMKKSSSFTFSIEFSIFRDVTPCTREDTCQCFGRTYRRRWLWILPKYWYLSQNTRWHFQEFRKLNIRPIRTSASIQIAPTYINI